MDFAFSCKDDPQKVKVTELRGHGLSGPDKRAELVKSISFFIHNRFFTAPSAKNAFDSSRIFEIEKGQGRTYVARSNIEVKFTCGEEFAEGINYVNVYSKSYEEEDKDITYWSNTFIKRNGDVAFDPETTIFEVKEEAKEIKEEAQDYAVREAQDLWDTVLT